ncbi:MAG: TolC family protein [Saprospiraceae bacterium]|nr:TolC family protein [Saprospiraceae bacterium]
MTKKSIALVAFTLTLGFSASAQRLLSLSDCVQIAEENTLTLKQAKITIENAEIGLKEAKMSRLPRVNGSVGAGLQFGRTIDPTTNDFGTSEIGYNSISINGGMNVFNGGRINSSIRQGRYDLEAARYAGEDIYNNLGLTLASVFLQIMLAEDQLENAKRQVTGIEEQYVQSQKLAEAGVIPVNDLLDIEAQLALNQQNVFVAEGNLEVSRLTLVQLLELDANEQIKLIRPQVGLPTIDPMSLSLEQIYQTALGSQASIKANDFRLRSAEENIAQARSLGLPQLNLFGGLSTNWSSLGVTVEGFQDVLVPLEIYDGNGQSLGFSIGQQVPILADQPYMDQLNQNFGQNVGVSLSVPIFNGLTTKYNVQRARLGAKNQKLVNNQQRQQLKTDVQSALIQARTAKLAYYAAEKSTEAAQMAYDNAEKRFELGTINTLELNTSRNLRDRAGLDLLNAKYQYIFNMKVLDFYMGKGLTLD